MDIQQMQYSAAIIRSRDNWRENIKQDGIDCKKAQMIANFYRYTFDMNYNQVYKLIIEEITDLTLPEWDELLSGAAKSN